jgi:hypothetical protein
MGSLWENVAPAGARVNALRVPPHLSLARVCALSLFLPPPFPIPWRVALQGGLGCRDFRASPCVRPGGDLHPGWLPQEPP